MLVLRTRQDLPAEWWHCGSFWERWSHVKRGFQVVRRWPRSFPTTRVRNRLRVARSRQSLFCRSRAADYWSRVAAQSNRLDLKQASGTRWCRALPCARKTKSRRWCCIADRNGASPLQNYATASWSGIAPRRECRAHRDDARGSSARPNEPLLRR